jgi:flagellar motor switch protein FliN/FliY
VSSRKKLDIEQIQDIRLPVSLYLGNTKMKIRELLELKAGSVVSLDRLAGETVDFVVNNKIIAKGEVVIIDDSFGVRLVTLLSPEERLKLM